MIVSYLLCCAAPGSLATQAAEGRGPAAPAPSRTASAFPASHAASCPATTGNASSSPEHEHRSTSPIPFRAGFAYERQQTPQHKARLRQQWEQQQLLQFRKHISEGQAPSGPKGVLKHSNGSSQEQQQQQQASGAGSTGSTGNAGSAKPRTGTSPDHAAQQPADLPHRVQYVIGSEARDRGLVSLTPCQQYDCLLLL